MTYREFLGMCDLVIIDAKRLEAKCIRLPLNTRLMYYDLLSLPDEINTVKSQTLS